jgi:hypothetical protein
MAGLGSLERLGRDDVAGAGIKEAMGRGKVRVIA